MDSQRHGDATGGTFGPENPFYAASALPFGVPPFDRIRDEHYEPALLAGMEQHRREIEAIASDAAPASFENTLVAMEHSGRLLSRVSAALGGVAGAYTNPTIEELQAAMAPKMAAHSDAIYLDARLFARVKAVYEGRLDAGLEGEALRLLELTYVEFVHAGAQLNDADKERLKAMNEESSRLSNTFRQRLLAATNAASYRTTERADLKGLSEAQVAAAAALAKERGVEGYVLPLHNTTQQPVLSALEVRATREAVFACSWSRTERGDDNDTREIVARMAQVRAEKAKLLGYATYAAWKLDDQMAKTPEAALSFLHGMAGAAVEEARVEEAEIQALIDREGGEYAVQPWDWDFYSEQVRRSRYEIDDEAIRPYFEINRVLRDGVFFAATQLFGIQFAQRHDLPTYAPDVEVFEILNVDGSHLAILYCDLWKRDNKRGGAWMGSFVRQSRLQDESSVIYNVSNFTKPAEGEPGLIRFDDVTTMFHEFGHALHGMFSDVMYPSLSGTSVPRDFVEFPSQFNEYWATHPEIFRNYARHVETGEPMPEELVQRLKAAAKFNHGYERTELLAAATLDMAWHTMEPGLPLQDTAAFERAALERHALAVRAVPPRYRSTYFAHAFAGGYAAGYYAYLWSEMLENAAIAWLEENGGLTRSNGDRLRTMVLSRGNSEDLGPMFDQWVGKTA
jgi:peptidyl-dipeptidase Dcp